MATDMKMSKSRETINPRLNPLVDWSRASPGFGPMAGHDASQGRQLRQNTSACGAKNRDRVEALEQGSNGGPA